MSSSPPDPLPSPSTKRAPLLIAHDDLWRPLYNTDLCLLETFFFFFFVFDFVQCIPILRWGRGDLKGNPFSATCYIDLYPRCVGFQRRWVLDRTAIMIVAGAAACWNSLFPREPHLFAECVSSTGPRLLSSSGKDLARLSPTCESLLPQNLNSIFP